MAKRRVPAALAAEWEAKLSASGFVDVENRDGSIARGGHSLRTHIRVENRTHGSSEAYYERAAAWEYHHVWHSRRDRRIWQLHSEGKTLEEVMLGMGPSSARHRAIAWPTIRRLAKYMTLTFREPETETVYESLHAEELSTFPTFDSRLTDPSGRTRRLSQW